MKFVLKSRALERILSGALLFLSISLCTVNAQAATLIPTQSYIHFTCQVMGGPTRGQFNHFQGQIELDPANPTKGHALILVDPASIEISSSEAEEEARGKNWFDVKRFPEMRFESKTIQSSGGSNFLVKGRMSVAGVAMDLSIPVSLQTTGNNQLVKGRFGLKRSWFHLGKGEWAAFDTVGDDVTVEFQMALQR